MQVIVSSHRCVKGCSRMIFSINVTMLLFVLCLINLVKTETVVTIPTSAYNTTQINIGWMSSNSLFIRRVGSVPMAIQDYNWTAVPNITFR